MLPRESLDAGLDALRNPLRIFAVRARPGESWLNCYLASAQIFLSTENRIRS